MWTTFTARLWCLMYMYQENVPCVRFLRGTRHLAFSKCSGECCIPVNKDHLSTMIAFDCIKGSLCLTAFDYLYRKHPNNRPCSNKRPSPPSGKIILQKLIPLKCPPPQKKKKKNHLVSEVMTPH